MPNALILTPPSGHIFHIFHHDCWIKSTVCTSTLKSNRAISPNPILCPIIDSHMVTLSRSRYWTLCLCAFGAQYKHCKSNHALPTSSSQEALTHSPYHHKRKEKSTRYEISNVTIEANASYSVHACLQRSTSRDASPPGLIMCRDQLIMLSEYISVGV